MKRTKISKKRPWFGPFLKECIALSLQSVMNGVQTYFHFQVDQRPEYSVTSHLWNYSNIFSVHLCHQTYASLYLTLAQVTSFSIQKLYFGGLSVFCLYLGPVFLQLSVPKGQVRLYTSGLHRLLYDRCVTVVSGVLHSFDVRQSLQSALNGL